MAGDIYRLSGMIVEYSDGRIAPLGPESTQEVLDSRVGYKSFRWEDGDVVRAGDILCLGYNLLSSPIFLFPKGITPGPDRSLSYEEFIRRDEPVEVTWEEIVGGVPL